MPKEGMIFFFIFLFFGQKPEEAARCSARLNSRGGERTACLSFDFLMPKRKRRGLRKQVGVFLKDVESTIRARNSEKSKQGP